MPARINIPLDVPYGRLTVLSEAEPHRVNGHVRYRRWSCLCICGATVVVRQDNLTRGITESCGCLNKERSSEAHLMHGVTGSPEHLAWQNLKGRCAGRTDKTVRNYKDRGIVVCDGWREDFVTFLTDVGLRPNPELSIDRKDNNGNYSCGHCEQCLRNGWPMNVRWATRIQQRLNQRPR